MSENQAATKRTGNFIDVQKKPSKNLKIFQANKEKCHFKLLIEKRKVAHSLEKIIK
jgi:hypothetical protein